MTTSSWGEQRIHVRTARSLPRRLFLITALVAALLPGAVGAEPPSSSDCAHTARDVPVAGAEAGPPPWPDDPLSVQVVHVPIGPAGEPGSWVWDPNHFAGGSGVSHTWTPRWVWVTAPGTV
ncbi:MAG: hypothetical protein HY331_07745 [Chloroflexi bacterium]|nr:hypothetical protein [Chloroflexota bacterium]